MTADHPCNRDGCGHWPEAHDPAPLDSPDAYGACSECDCEEYE